MKYTLLIIPALVLFTTGCVEQQSIRKVNTQNPNPQKYTVNSHGCLKKKTLWRQLGI